MGFCTDIIFHQDDDPRMLRWIGLTQLANGAAAVGGYGGPLRWEGTRVNKSYLDSRQGSPPYFDRLLQRLALADPDVQAAFGRHVHWGLLERSNPRELECQRVRACSGVRYVRKC